MSEKDISLSIIDRLTNVQSSNLSSQFIPVRGTESKIMDMGKNNGYVYFTTDTRKIYMDTDTEEKLLMGGSSGIFYAHHEHQDTPPSDQISFEFSIDDLEDQTRLPNIDDLILNLSDGCFYRVKEYGEDNDGTIIVDRITLAGGGGSGEVGGGRHKIVWNTDRNPTAIYKKPFSISFNIEAFDENGIETEDHNYIVRLQKGGTTNIKDAEIVKRGTVQNGLSDIELSEFLTEVGIVYGIRVEVSINRGGDIYYPETRNFNVTLTNVSLEWNHKQEEFNYINEPYTFSYKDWTFSGVGNNKRLIITFDDYNELPAFPISGYSADITINPQDYNIGHGVHKVKLQGAVDVSGETLYTDPVYHNIIFVDSNEGTTLISCELFDTQLMQYTTVSIPIVIYSPNNSEDGLATIILIENGEELTRWTNRKNLTVYNWLYTPSVVGDNIPLTVSCDNEEANLMVNIQSLDIDNEEVSGYNFKFKASEMTDNEDIINWAANGEKASFSSNFDWINGGLRSEKEVDENGQETGNVRQYLLIKNGSFITLNNYPFKTSASDSGMSLKIIYKTVNCKDYDAQFLTCYESKKVLRYNSSEEVELEIPQGTLIEYTGQVDIDENGILSWDTSNGTIGEVTYVYSQENLNILNTLNKKYIKIKDDDTIYYFSYRLDANKGNEIVITFNPTYVADRGIGIKMKAQETEFSCNSSSLTIPYYEESYIELEFDIAKNEKDNKQYRKRYIKPWLDGVPCGIALYDNSDEILQKKAQPIVIGSNDCDVCLYMFKTYKKSLSDNEHLENFIADAPNGAEMKKRFDRNDILNEQLTIDYKQDVIDYIKLSQKNPNCHVHLYNLEKMTTSKNTPVGVYSYEQYLNGERILSAASSNSNAPVEGKTGLSEDERNRCAAQVKVQGTSSAAYGLAAFNLDTDFTHLNNKNERVSSLKDSQNNYLPDGWSMDEDAIPCTFFCTKVNVASCEGANNALNQEWYNYHQPYIGAARKQNYDQYGNLKAGPKYRDTMQFKPGVVFVKDHNKSTTDKIGVNNNVFKEVPGYVENPTHLLYSIGCMGNSKDNVHVFHTPNECCIENGDNQLPGQWMTICPGAYVTEEKTYYVDLENIKENESTYIEEIGKSIPNYQLWLTALDDLYGFRYPDGIKEVQNHEHGKDMIQGWFDFVYWMSRNDPSPRYEVIEIKNQDEFEYQKYSKGKLYKIIFNGNGDIDEYKAIEDDDNFDSNITYYYETPHIHGPTGKRLKEPEIFGAHEFKGDEYTQKIGKLIVDSYAGEYTHDTKDYRIARMLKDCEDYLVMDSVVYHYLFIERHTMVDNVAKNTFWSSSDYKHWDLTKNYDNDTADGNDNQGKLTLNYGYEIGDLKNGSSVFNAGPSVWINFIKELSVVKKHMYQNLPDAWKPDTYLKSFNDWQNAIPERCWIIDYHRKYLRPWEEYNDYGFLDRLEGGKKTHQREQYERYQSDYLNSKYQTDTTSMFDFRSYGTGNIDLTLETYADGYINIALGKGVVTPNHSFRIKRNEPKKWEVKNANFEDATFYILHPKNIQNIGDEQETSNSLAPFNITTFAGTTYGIKLRKLILGTFEDKFNKFTRIPDINFSGLKMLETLYACNMEFLPVGNNEVDQGYGSSTLDLKECENIRFVDARNSNFTVVTIADGAPLEILKLNAPTSLIMSNLYDLNELYIDSYSFIQSVELDNIDNNIINSKIDIIDKIKESSSIFSSYKLLNVKWNISNSNEFSDSGINVLDWLLEKSGKLTGKLTIGAEAYNGNNSLELYEKYSNKDIFPELDIEFEGEAAKLYTVKIKDGNGDVIWTRKVKPGDKLKDATFFTGIEDGEDSYIPPYGALQADKIIKLDTSTMTYTKTGNWIINGDSSDTVESDKNGYPNYYDTEIDRDMVFECQFEEKTRYYTVTLYDGDGNILKKIEDEIEYSDTLEKVLNKLGTIPYKDDSDLGLKETYNYLGYHYNQNSNIALPNTYKIVSNIELYPVFELIKDITTITPHYDYFLIEEASNDYEEPSEVLNSQKYKGYVLRPNKQLRGKVVLPKTYNGNPIIRYSGFKTQSEITHIFFHNEQVSHLFEIGDNCFQHLSNLKYFQFNDNLGIIGSYAFNLTGLQTSLYGGLISFGKNLCKIGQSGLNQAFQKSYALNTIEPTVNLPDRLTVMNAYAFTYNDGLKGFVINIGGNETLSNLNLTKTFTSPVIACNSATAFKTINFYTEKYTSRDEITSAFNEYALEKVQFLTMLKEV